MPGEVQVLVYGAELVAQELVATGERADNLTEFWYGVASKLESIEREQFASSGSRGPNGPWPENTNEWDFHKFTHGLSLERMRATEALMLALTGPGDAAVRDPSPTELHFGANLKQFDVWQGGYDGKGTGERVPIDLTAEDEREIAMDIMAHITGAYTLDRRGRRRLPAGRAGGGRFA